MIRARLKAVVARRHAVVLAGSIWASVHGPADAATGDIELDSPIGCPDGEWLRDEVARLTSRSTREIEAHARITALESGYELVLEVRTAGEAGTRSLVHGSCESLARTAALIIALAVDPMATVISDRPSALLRPYWGPREAAFAAGDRGTSRAAPARVPIEVGSADVPLPSPRRKAAIGGAIRLFGAAESGMLPSFGPGTGLAGILAVPHVWLELMATYWFARSAQIAETQSGAELRAGWAAVRICPLAYDRVVTVPICVGAELGALRGRGVGLSQPRTFTPFWAALHAGPALAWAPGGRLAVWGEVDGVLALRRPRFLADEWGLVYRPRRLAVRVAIGLEVRFP